jgi:hypothetical protein
MEIKDAVRNAMEFAVTSLGAERTVGIECKTFTVDKETGEVLAMKIRLLAVPTV